MPSASIIDVDVAEREALAGDAARAARMWRDLAARDGEAAVAELRVRAHRHFRRGDWRAADRLYAALAAVRPRYRHLRRRAAWCLKHADRFAATHMTPAHRQRVIEALRPRLPEAADLQTRPGPGGLNSIRNFRHRLLDRDGRTVAEVFEKSFLGTEAKGFERVRLLFENHPAEAFLAPAYFAAIAHGPFRALLQEAVAGDRPDAEEWPRVRRRIVARLWQQPPGPAVRTGLRHTRWRNLLERLRAPGVFVNTTLWWPAATPREWIGIAGGRSFTGWLAPFLPKALAADLERARPAITRRLRRLPLFVMHADLHRGNVLLDRDTDRIWTVDWDRWTAEPVGAGWPVDPTEADPVPGLDEALAAGRVSPARDDAVLAALLWDLRASFRAGQFARLEPVSELVLRAAKGWG